MHLCITTHDGTFKMSKETRRFLLDGPRLKASTNTFSSKLGTVVIRSLCPQENDNNIPRAKVVMEITCDEKEMIKLASRVVTSLRLSQEEGLGYNREFRDNTPKPIDEYGLPYRPAKILHCSWNLTNDTMTSANSILQLVEKIANREFVGDSILQLALSRFNRSYDDVNAEDVLIDLMICLEILFVRHEWHKNCKIQKRAGTFLMNRGFTGSIVKQALRKAYCMRNDAVHDGKRYNSIIKETKYSVKDPRAFLLEIRRYARECLCGYIERLNKNTGLKSEDLKKSL